MIRALPAAGSAALLLGALGFQYLGGLAPCELCIWQRWPHAVAIALGLLLIALPVRLIAPLGAVAMVVGAGVAGFHVGVEQGWWQGLAACSSGGGLAPGGLLDFEGPTGVVQCDAVAWSFAGLSMAAWNGLASLALAALWLWIAVSRPSAPHGRAPHPAT